TRRERPDHLFVAPVPWYAHPEDEAVAARLEMSGLPAVRAARVHVVRRTDGHVRLFLPVVVHVAEDEIERSVLVLLPPFEGGPDRLPAGVGLRGERGPRNHRRGENNED